MAQRYRIKFLEIGADRNYAHFLVQSVPAYSGIKIVMISSNASRLGKYSGHSDDAFTCKALWGSDFRPMDIF
ncbi:MAG: hypothetical protein E5299_00004 [Burkholderia gladioli]|nr:MAG: hypothetical protein E5299_00004 [Burkholderia gladioli]